MSTQTATEIAPQVAASPAARKLGLALLVIAAAQLMLVLDDIVNVALPSMQRPLHLAPSSLNWVISFYALAFGGLLLAGGRARRPARPPASVPLRHNRVRPGLDGGRVRPGRGCAARRPPAPLIPRRVVRDRNRSGANTVLLLLGAGMLAMSYLLTLYMQLVRG